MVYLEHMDLTLRIKYQEKRAKKWETSWNIILQSLKSDVYLTNRYPIWMMDIKISFTRVELSPNLDESFDTMIKSL